MQTPGCVHFTKDGISKLPLGETEMVDLLTDIEKSCLIKN